MQALYDALPDAARDIKLNLSNVLGGAGSGLSPVQRWGSAIAASIAARSPRLTAALVASAREAGAAEAAIDDGYAAASVMAMTNVLYRFKHLAGDEAYEHKPARLRMQRLARPATSKLDFELMCLVVSTLYACPVCVRAHERTVREGGATDDQVMDAVRIAAVVHGAAVALDAPAYMPIVGAGTTEAA